MSLNSLCTSSQELGATLDISDWKAGFRLSRILQSSWCEARKLAIIVSRPFQAASESELLGV